MSILALVAGLACRGRSAHRQQTHGRRRLPVRPADEDDTADKRLCNSFPITARWSASKRRCPTADDLSPGAEPRPQTQASAASQAAAYRLSQQCRGSALSDVVMPGPSPAGRSRQRSRSESRDSPLTSQTLFSYECSPNDGNAYAPCTAEHDVCAMAVVYRPRRICLRLEAQVFDVSTKRAPMC
jgi:hypothetical protein